MENESIIEHTYADEVSPLTLAFVGDGVYDLLVRAYLVRQSNRPVGELNKIKVGFVNCKSQAEYAKVLIPHLSEKELSVYKRGRNAKSVTMAKHATMIDYRMATGFEALMGYLYLTEQFDRMAELLGKGLEQMGELISL